VSDFWRRDFSGFFFSYRCFFPVIVCSRVYDVGFVFFVGFSEFHTPAHTTDTPRPGFCGCSIVLFCVSLGDVWRMARGGGGGVEPDRDQAGGGGAWRRVGQIGDMMIACDNEKTRSCGRTPQRKLSEGLRGRWRTVAGR